MRHAADLSSEPATLSRWGPVAFLSCPESETHLTHRDFLTLLISRGIMAQHFSEEEQRMDEAIQTLSDDKLTHIWDALREVYDPEIPISIVDLGLVRKIKQVDGEVIITMILTAPFCPLANLIMEQAREAAQSASDVPVRVELGTERWNPSMMAQDASSTT
jgi:metal-sulfur cluster biosynthetic enzyme